MFTFQQIPQSADQEKWLLLLILEARLWNFYVCMNKVAKVLQIFPLFLRHQDVDVNLIVTDYCMPGMTGYDLLGKIEESNVFKDISVVIMSSENEPSRINRCLEEGAEEFFVKQMQLSDVNKLRPHMLKGRSSMDMQDQSNFIKREQEQNIMT